jgi:S-adenosylmethionine hydrolase
MAIITLTTDFGNGSPYVAAMKGVILGIDPAATIVDLTHGVPPQDIRQGAIALADVARHFPPGTIHVAVVDPGVGTRRAVVYARCGRQQYVLPDNGLLSLAARRDPPSLIVELAEPKYWREEVSPTFHGRDIMAPAAAHVSKGLDPAKLGSTRRQLIDFDWPQVEKTAGRIVGSVLAVDTFGNLLTDITSEHLRDIRDPQAVVVRCGPGETRGLVAAFGVRPAEELVALVGSAGRLELAVVNGSAANWLAAAVGDSVTITWDE